jgi:DNA-binding PadR family transcriptional regulator
LNNVHHHLRIDWISMAANSTNIDFNGLIDELKNFAKVKLNDLGARRPAGTPDDSKIATAIMVALDGGDKNLQQLTQSISLASGGAWNPSVGTLQKAIGNLTDDGNVSATTDGDRKVYSLTKKGRKALEVAKEAQTESEAADGADSASSGSRTAWLACDPQFLVAASKLGPALLDIAQTGTREQQSKAAAMLEKTRNELHQILANNS